MQSQTLSEEETSKNSNPHPQIERGPDKSEPPDSASPSTGLSRRDFLHKGLKTLAYGGAVVVMGDALKEELTAVRKKIADVNESEPASQETENKESLMLTEEGFYFELKNLRRIMPDLEAYKAEIERQVATGVALYATLLTDSSTEERTVRNNVDPEIPSIIDRDSDKIVSVAKHVAPFGVGAALDKVLRKFGIRPTKRTQDTANIVGGGTHAVQYALRKRKEAQNDIEFRERILRQSETVRQKFAEKMLPRLLTPPAMHDPKSKIDESINLILHSAVENSLECQTLYGARSPLQQFGVRLAAAYWDI